ncbi:MAG: DUF5947 family protein [Candidatus Binatia bacterium]
MTYTPSAGIRTSFAALQKFVAPRAPAAERCDFCSAALSVDHQHLIPLQSRNLVCACDACAVLFGSSGETKYRRLTRTIRYLPDFRQTDSQWEALGLPIGLAFFFYSTPAGKVVALYPSPGGPTESLLDLAAWNEIAALNPAVKEMEPDIEGLLVNRVKEARDYYRVPIDVCFKLTGLIRRSWRGFSGGAQVWREIDQFFADLKQRAKARGETSCA